MKFLNNNAVYDKSQIDGGSVLYNSEKGKNKVEPLKLVGF